MKIGELALSGVITKIADQKLSRIVTDLSRRLDTVYVYWEKSTCVDMNLSYEF